MFNVFQNGTIYVNRGDSFQMPLVLNVGTKLEPLTYELDDNSFVYFGLMEPNQPFEDAIVRKMYTKADTDEYGRVIIQFSPQDTQCLLPGKYYYQVKLQVFDSKDKNKYYVETVIDKTQFFIME